MDKLHKTVECEESNAWYHHRSNARGGHWMLQFTCPMCQRSGKFQRNYLGQRKVYCDGIRFTKLFPREVTHAEDPLR